MLKPSTTFVATTCLALAPMMDAQARGGACGTGPLCNLTALLILGFLLFLLVVAIGAGIRKHGLLRSVFGNTAIRWILGYIAMLIAAGATVFASAWAFGKEGALWAVAATLGIFFAFERWARRKKSAQSMRRDA
jgi:hypothetical protein